jgi:hypothetical protein
MNETRIDDRIDDAYQEDGAVDDIALLPAQYIRLRTLHSLSTFQYCCRWTWYFFGVFFLVA